MARRKTRRRPRRRYYGRRRRRRTRTLPIAPLAGFATGIFAKPHSGAHNSPFGAFINKDIEGGFNLLVENYTGLYPPTGSFDLTHAKGLQGVIIGTLIHKLAGWIGVNRQFSNLPSPLNKIRV